MSDTAESFLASRLPIVGLAAYSIQAPDRVLASECLSKGVFQTSAEQMLTTIVQAGRNLLPAEKSSAQYCWTFEFLKVFVATRADGNCLALLVENNPTVQAVRIRETLQAFLDLPEV